MGSNRSSGVGPFIFGAIVGGVVGAAVALVLAPAEGSEIRQGISDKLDDLGDSVSTILKRARVSAEKVMNDGREESERIIDEARSRAEDLIEDADRTIQAARQAARRARSSATSEGHNGAADNVPMNGSDAEHE